jgi:hypothetical protein
MPATLGLLLSQFGAERCLGSAGLPAVLVAARLRRVFSEAAF